MTSRAALADAVVRELTAACAGSRARVRGSLANGTADEYSDIDVEWVVPDGRVPECVADIAPIVARVCPVAAVRSSPDFFHSRVRRLVFVRFSGVPLFWRLDLVVREAAADERPEPAAQAHEGEWLRPASALANALGAVKAVARGRLEDAKGLVERGFARIGVPDVVTGEWADDITRLALAAAARESELGALAEETIALARETLRCC
ncbi:MAG TPA: hypothetical protein VG674_15830 [Amycolatopsis sp.]|nr:hypothetical protein [Amycolatopsis sp.]